MAPRGRQMTDITVTVERLTAPAQQIHHPGRITGGHLGVSKLDRVVRGAVRHREAEVVEDLLRCVELAAPSISDAGVCLQLADGQKDPGLRLAIVAC